MMSLIPAEHRKHADVRFFFFFFADHGIKSLTMQINSLSFDLNVDSLLKRKKKRRKKKRELQYKRKTIMLPQCLLPFFPI